MKKALFCILALFISIVLFAQQQVNLSEAITRTARAVEEVLPPNNKVAVLNFASPSETFSDYIIEELTGELVNGRKVTIVDRRNLALITQEMNLQLSGDVSDESAQAIGRMLGAQSIVSGTITNMGNFHRFRIRVINVETAAIQTQVSLDLGNDAQVAFLLGNSQPNTPPATSGGVTPATSTSSITGTIVPGNNLTEKLAWLQRSAESHNTYIIEITANESIAPQTLRYEGGVNITIVLKGNSANQTIRLRSNGTMFTVRSNVTLIMENNITLHGHNGNNGNIVEVNGGMLKMNSGTTITGNMGGGGGVYVRSGTFEMTGGTISNNGKSKSFYGGGVDVRGTFTMSGGTISGNIASQGGGVYVAGTFNMRGGTISGNTATEKGGGVCFIRGTFNKGGGIITGYSSDSSNGNVVRDDAGNILARVGHAAFVSSSRRKETTAGQGVNLSNSSAGGWDS